MYNKDNLPSYEDFVKKSPSGIHRDHLAFCLNKIRFDGMVLEFGVYKGKTLNQIASFVKPKTVYGFDSFEGLPEYWGVVNQAEYKKGSFGVNPDTVKFEDNIELVKGYFDETIPKFNKNPISFLHVDCDIYQSAYTVLSLLNDYIKPSTIIVFDELANWTRQHMYPHYEEHEWKALRDWTTEFDREFSILGRSNNLAASIIVNK